MGLESTRRGFITGLIAFTATAPAIVRAGSLMPVKAMIEPPMLITWREPVFSPYRAFDFVGADEYDIAFFVKDARLMDIVTPLGSMLIRR